MSQPVALVAKVKIDETHFKGFLKSKSAELLAACIDESLDIPDCIYYVFRYLKTEQAVFAFFYFNEGDERFLRDSRELQVLQGLAPFADAGRAGVILGGPDALDLDSGDTFTLYSIEDRQCVDSKASPASEWPSLMKDCLKYFYKETDTPFALNLPRSRIVDKSIVKRCKKLAEQRRLQGLSQQLHTASATRPLHLFTDFFYNGKSIYHQDHESFYYQDNDNIVLLPQLDPQSFSPTPYGAADAHHAVVALPSDNQVDVLQVDVASFRMLQKGELIYFKDKTQVFDEHRQPIAGADAASFQIKSAYHAEDANRLYFIGRALDKSELGHYRIYPAAYFNIDKLLLAEHAIYLGTQKLPVDAASFQVLRAMSAGACGKCSYVVSDRNGQYILFSSYNNAERTSKAHLIPTVDPEKTWEELKDEIR